jgi:hypothetical protein
MGSRQRIANASIFVTIGYLDIHSEVALKADCTDGRAFRMRKVLKRSCGHLSARSISGFPLISATKRHTRAGNPPTRSRSARANAWAAAM